MIMHGVIIMVCDHSCSASEELQKEWIQLKQLFFWISYVPQDLQSLSFQKQNLSPDRWCPNKSNQIGAHWKLGFKMMKFEVQMCSMWAIRPSLKLGSPTPPFGGGGVVEDNGTALLLINLTIYALIRISYAFISWYLNTNIHELFNTLFSR